MRSSNFLRNFGILLPFGFLTSCELFEEPYIDNKSKWIYKNSAPLAWRSSTHGSPRVGYTKTVEIKNISPKKVTFLGLCTRHEGVSFVDLQQPGAFQETLYPDEIGFIHPDGGYNTSTTKPGPVRVIIQDFIYE